MKLRRPNGPRLQFEFARVRAPAGVGTGLAAIIAGALVFAPLAASAAASVSGTPDAVTVKSQDSSVEDILAALSHQFKLKYRSSADLNTQISGTYEGSLRRVVARILEGYNFVLSSSPNGINVIVLPSHGAPANAVTVAAQAQSSPQGSPQPSAAAVTKAAPAQSAKQPQPTPSTASKSPVPTPDIKLAEGSLPAPPMPKPAAPGASLPAPPIPKAPAAGSSFAAPPIPKAPAAGSSFAAPPIPSATAGAAAMPAPPVPPQLAGPGTTSSSQPAPTSPAKPPANGPTPAAPAPGSKSN